MLLICTTFLCSGEQCTVICYIDRQLGLIQMFHLLHDAQVEPGSDAPSECKVDQRVTSPAENGLSHTPIIAAKPPSLVGQTQSAGATYCT